MNPEIATLERELTRFEAKAQECADIIKQLTGYDPTNFSVTFFANKQPIVTFEIGRQEMNFSIGVFMSWHSFFCARIKEHRTILDAMRAGHGAACPA